MYYKVSPILIVILILALVIVGFGIVMLLNGANDGKGNNVQIEMSDIVPSLDLSVNTEEENQESVIIKAIATTDDENGIHSIILPNGSAIRNNEAEYQATENGNYTFKVKGNNSQTSSLTIEITNIHEASASTPYIPEGFSHVEGESENGFVIRDSQGNEFVWIPVEDGKLIRNTMLDGDYEESNSTASALVNSVAQNYGFYIGRYEASEFNVNNTTVAGSLPGKMPWTNVTYPVAASAAENTARVLEYQGCHTAILNSFAWDTTLNWIDKTFQHYSTNTGYGNYSGTIRKSGETQTDIKNNICDIAGNVREWTTELYKNPTTRNTSNKNNKNVTNEIVSETVNYRVVRGGSANLGRTASSHTGYKENLSDNYWGFRIILYK